MIKYGAVCTNCKARSGHSSGLCGPCRKTTCSDCGTRYIVSRYSSITKCSACKQKIDRHAEKELTVGNYVY